MRWIRRYNESRTIKVYFNTIKRVLNREIEKLGNDADLNYIDVSIIINMKELFKKSQFNGDISQWNVGNVKDMSWMFSRSQFNGDISQWNVSNVRDMSYMFSRSQFNGDISQWNVSKVKNMDYMFYLSSFYGDLTNWDVYNIRMKYILRDSLLENNPPLWYFMDIFFESPSKYKESIKVYEWLDLERKIIWKKRLNYALQDFGKEDYEIPKSIWGFTIL